jgi:hypothetical protein
MKNLRDVIVSYLDAFYSGVPLRQVPAFAAFLRSERAGARRLTG